MPRTITLTEEQVQALGEALDLAYGDQESYLSIGNPSVDYGNEWPETAAAKAQTFRHLGEVGELLGFHGEQERWGALADSTEVSGVEYAEEHG